MNQEKDGIEAKLHAIFHEAGQLSQPQDMPRRIELYQQALDILPQIGNESLWADLKINLGNSLIRNPSGNRAENIDRGIQNYQQALEVYSDVQFPEDWASVMVNLAMAYNSRIQGDRAENIELTIHHYKQALKVYSTDFRPQKWALIQYNMAIAFNTRIYGNYSENIEQVIHYYGQSLRVYSLEQSPVMWAKVMTNLGIAYGNRVQGEQAENIELAIHYYQQALSIQSRDQTPIRWDNIQNQIGLAYYHRIRGDRADNIELAIYYYQQALDMQAQGEFLRDWAGTVTNLATAYFYRINGERGNNIEKAIHHYQQALEVYTIDHYAERWAGVQNNLGNAYTVRINGERGDNIEKAIHHYQQALEVYTIDHYAERWALVQNNLGNAYYDRLQGEREQNIELALQYYEKALEVRSREQFSFDWAMTQNNLGNAYADRILGEQTLNRERSIYHYQQALEVYTREQFPLENRKTLVNIGDLHFEGKNWKDSLRCYRDAIATSNDIRAMAYSDIGQQSALAETSHLYIRATYSLLKLSQVSDALQQLESGKARLLADVLAMQDSNLMNLTNDQKRKLQSLRDRVRGLEVEYRLTTDNPTRRDERIIIDELRDIRIELRTYVNNLRQQYPEFMPEGFDIKTMLSLIPEHTVLLAPLFTMQGSAIFVVPHGTKQLYEEHIIHMDDYKLEMLNEMLNEWLRNYISYRAEQQFTKTFFASIESITDKLWVILIEKVYQHLGKLTDIKHVIVMPQGVLSLLPIHAAWHEVDGKRHYFMDDYQVTYVPSMYTLNAAQHRVSNQVGKEALVIGVSKYQKMNDLPNTKAEAEAIAMIFETQALIDADATVDAIKEQSAGKGYLHMSCHGAFSWGGSMFDSGLYLADDKHLSLADIMGNLSLDTVRLVTLSACETGIVDFQNIPDEFIGLPAGFMQAGASAVISTLWTVEDRSTALLMEHFYKQHLDKGKQPAQALREAQLWLRDANRQEIGDYYKQYLRMGSDEAEKILIQLMEKYSRLDKPYSHPFYWSAFVYHGI